MKSSTKQDIRLVVVASPACSLIWVVSDIIRMSHFDGPSTVESYGWPLSLVIGLVIGPVLIGAIAATLIYAIALILAVVAAPFHLIDLLKAKSIDL